MWGDPPAKRSREPHMRGGWSGTCPQCGLWLQGEDETVIGMHREIVHPARRREEEVGRDE